MKCNAAQKYMCLLTQRNRPIPMHIFNLLQSKLHVLRCLF